jgi:hypothetical protein
MADPRRQPWVEDLDLRSATAGRPPLVSMALEYAEARPEPFSLTPFMVFVATGLGAAVAWYCGEIFGGLERPAVARRDDLPEGSRRWCFRSCSNSDDRGRDGLHAI